MAGISFDDLVPKKSGAVSFDDLVPQQPKARAGSALEAAGIGIAGGQIPFGNVITSRLAAEATAPFIKQEGEGWRDAASRLYDEAQAYTKATQEANPTATTVGNVAGILSTLPAAFSKPVQGAGLIATPAKGLKSASDFAAKMVSVTPFKGAGVGAKVGNTLARAAGGAVVAAPIGGLYAAGEADTGNRMEAMGKGARNAALIGAALPVAGAVIGGLGGAAIKGAKNIKSGITARTEDAIVETIGAIKDGSRSLYSAADNAGVLARPDAVQPLLDDLAGVVKNKDIASQKLYSSTLGAIKDLGEDIAAGNTGLMTLDRHRQILGNLAKDITNPNKAQEAEAAGRAIGFIDDFIDNLTPDKLLSGDANAANALKAARSEWSKSKRFEKIGQIIINASNDANKLKRDLEKFRTNPKNTLGWSTEELNALKQAATQTTGEGALKLLGKFGFDLGGGRAVGNTALPVIGGLASGIGAGSTGVGALVPVIGTAARSAQKALASGKAEELLKVIEQGGKVTNQMIATLPQAEKNKFLKQVMQMPVAKAQQVLGEKIKPAMQKTKQFAKDYIADESGALNIGGKKNLPVNATQDEFNQMLSATNTNRPYIVSWLGQRGVSKKKGFSAEEISSIADDAMKYRREVLLKDVIEKQKIAAEQDAVKRAERSAYLNSPEYQRKNIEYELKELDAINSAKDRLKWSIPSIKEVENYHNFYGKDSFNDRFYSNEAAKKATLEAIQREAKKRGIEIVHSSGKASAKNASSIYLKHPEFGEVRVSNHQLPDTPQRQHHRDNYGARWNGEYIIGNDWKKLTLDEIFEKIKQAGIGEK